MPNISFERLRVVECYGYCSGPYTNINYIFALGITSLNFSRDNTIEINVRMGLLCTHLPLYWVHLLNCSSNNIIRQSRSMCTLPSGSVEVQTLDLERNLF